MKLIINEQQFNFLINEELGIARDVVKITSLIEKEVYNFINADINKYNYDILNDLALNLKKVYYNNIYEFYDAYNDNNNVYKNGYSFLDKTIYLTILIINGKISNIDNLENTIQHEVAHYWQCKMKKSGLSTPHYQEIFELVKNNNEYISTIGKLLYYSKKFEIDAQINGAFNELKNNKISNIEDVFEKTELGNLKNILNEIRNKIISWDYNSYQVEYALNVVNVNKLIRKKSKTSTSKPFTKNKLINIINKTLDYFYKKVARMYTLYVEKNNLSNLQQIKEGLKNNKITIFYLS